MAKTRRGTAGRKQPKADEAAPPEPGLIEFKQVAGTVQITVDSRVPEPEETFYANTARVERQDSGIVIIALGQRDSLLSGMLQAAVSFEFPPSSVRALTGTFNESFRKALAAAAEDFGAMPEFAELAPGKPSGVMFAHFVRSQVNDNWCRLDFYEFSPVWIPPDRLRVSPLLRVRTTAPVVAHLVQRLDELTEGTSA